MSILTEKALAASLKKLLEKKTLNKITVRDITDDCGVNRQTFYYHFHDVYDLVEWIFTQDAKQYAADFQTKKWNEVISMIMNDLMQEKSFMMNAYYSLNRRQLEEFLRKLAEPAVRDVTELRAGGRLTETDKELITDIATLSLIGIITEWIADGMREDYKLKLDRMFQMMDGTMERLIDNFEKEYQGEES